jgi:hypothetical protein
LSQAAWVCDSCETNNFTKASVCRVCRRARGSTTGRVEAPSHAEPPTRKERRPKFVESKHTVGPSPVDRPKIWLTPPRVPEPVRRPSLPPGSGMRPPRPAASARRLRVKVMLGIVILAVAFTILDKCSSPVSGLPSSYSTSDPARASSLPCPAEVTTWLPGYGAGAVLVARYQTDQHVVTLCRDGAGLLHYDGRMRGAEVTPRTHISINATQTANGFTARNGSYLYEIDGLELTVRNGNQPISRQHLTPTGP